MPPEPIPWDRKDLAAAKDRKHDHPPGVDALGAEAGAAPRWRDPYHPLPRRPPPPGHSRQGSAYHQVYPDGTPAQSGERPWPEDEPFRASSARYAGGRTSSGRDSRGLFRRSPYRDSIDLSRQHQDFPPHVTGPRSAAVPVSPRLLLKDQHDKICGEGWKPHKWTRPCSLKGAKFGSDEATRAEMPVLAGKESPIRSPIASPLMSDDVMPRKKPRLTWGQGLAKHEKQKVEGSSDTAGQSGLVQCASSVKTGPDDTSPKVTSGAVSSSPATLCSAISSSSHGGLEENLCMKESNNDSTRPHDLSGQGLLEEFSIKLDPLEADAVSNLTSLLTDLLQQEDACSGDSSFTSHTAMNKLLVLKGDISKELEKTECEIDLLEHELKTLNGDDENRPVQSSFSLPVTSSTEPCSGSSEITLEMPHDSIPSKDNVLASTTALVGKSLFCTDFLEDHGVGVKDTNDDSLGTASLKYGRPASSVERISDFGTLKLTVCPLDGGKGLTTLGGHGGENCLDAGSNYVYEDHAMSSNVLTDDNLIDLIIDSNRNAARKASQVFDKAISVDHPHFGIWEPGYILSCRRNDAHVREKIAKHRRQCKLKERVLGLKFRAFHHLWKEDMRLLSIRKNRQKSQKRFELCSRSSQSGSQRHRSSIRSRFTLPAGNLTLVPTTEMVDFTRKLLSDSQMKLYRGNLNMPALILDEMERKYSRFISFNGLVQNPVTFEKEREIINPWTQEEREVFMEMLATFGKDFTKISSFLTHKTTADCIEFYYKNHKSECFKNVKKRLDLRKQRQCLRSNTYLVTSGKKWNREVNAASLDVLGEASAILAHSNNNIRNQQKYARRSVSGSYPCLKVTRGNSISLERANTVDRTRHEQEIVAADVLAGIYGGSSEAISSCVTGSIDTAEKLNNVRMGRLLTQEVAQNIDEEDTCSDEGCGELETVDWTDDEKSLLIRALSIYGRDFAKISRFVRTRSREQCKIFFSKARKCLGLDVVHPGSGNRDALMSDMNGGRSDTDDACAAEIDSAICSTQSCSRMDVEFTQHVGDTSSDEFTAGNTPMHSKTERSSEQYEVVGTNHEEVGGKVDRFTPVPDDEKLAKEGGNPRSDKCLLENDETALRCNETEHCHQATKFVHKKGEEDGSDLGFAPVKPTTTLPVESEKMNADGLKSEVDSLQFVVPGSGFVSKRQIKVDKDVDSSVSLCFAQDSNGSGNFSSSGTKVTISNSLGFAPNNQHQIPLEVLSYLQKKSHIQLKQENSMDLPLNKVLPDPSSIYFEGLKHVTCQSILDCEENGNKQHHNSAAKDFYNPCLMGNLSVNQVGNILRGYPLQVSNHNGLKRDADHISEMSLLLENMSKGDGISQSNHLFFPDMSYEKNNDAQLLSSQSAIVFPLKSDNHLEAQLHPCSQNSCGGETEVQLHQTGDVKLFGQILSHPSSQKKSNPSSSQECDSQPLSPIQNTSLTMKPSNSKRDGTSVSVPGSGDHSAHAEVPLRSYGFWDGNRIQAGYPSSPESAVMVAKYHESLAKASFYPAKDSVPNSNGLLTDFEHPYVMTLAADGQRLDSLSELQKRNGFETVSGFQQQGRALLGVNMAGRGILVDAGRGVTYPVAALKMHYSGRTKVLTSEVESWSGDVRGK